MADQTSPPQRSIIFSGPIEPATTKFLRNACCEAVSQKVQRLKIQFSSGGGSLDDGFALYGFLKSLPYDLHMYNVGIVGSIANIVFLAGTKRFASPHSAFYLHDLSWNVNAQNFTSSSIHAETFLFDNFRSRIKAIFQTEAQLDQTSLESPEFFKEPQIYEPSAAKAAGIIHEIQDAAIPRGEPVLNISW